MTLLLGNRLRRELGGLEVNAGRCGPWLVMTAGAVLLAGVRLRRLVLRSTTSLGRSLARAAGFGGGSR